MASPSRENRSVRQTVAATAADHPVSLAFLFGSRARGEAHDRSDVDVAVVFDDDECSTPNRLRARLSLGADLAIALGTDEVDVIDLESASPPLVRAILRDGDRLVGTETDARRVREALLDDGADSRSPAQRFDDALAAIDDHLA